MEIKRSIYGELGRELAEPQVLVLVGPRQVGKATLMRRLASDARAAGHRTRYLDLEQPSDLTFLQGQAAEVIESLTENVDLVFVDEFYYLEDAGRVFKAIYDRSEQTGKRVKIVASGSSSVEVHAHLRESLAGRRITYRVFPLSWMEYRDWDSPNRPSGRDSESLPRFDVRQEPPKVSAGGRRAGRKSLCVFRPIVINDSGRR